MAGPVSISVVIAAYEAAACIPAAIAACLCQTETAIEVLVVDDASKVSLEAAVAAAAGGDPRVRYFRQDRNGGPSGARNRALAEARGTYVAILDADDTMRADRLATLLETACECRADIVVDNMIANRVGDRSETGPFLDPTVLDHALQIDLATYADPATTRKFGEPLGYLKPLIRREALDRAGIAYDTSLTNSEDFYLIAELLAHKARMVLTPYKGYVYTIQAGSISHRLNSRQTAAILAAERGFQARHAATMDEATRRACQQRLKHLRQVHQFETLIDDLKARAPVSFAGHLANSGVNAPAHLAKLAAIAARRFA